MSTWTSDELTRMGPAEELEVTFLRDDDSLGKPRTVWVVRDGDDIYLRSIYGRGSAWYRGATHRHAGHVRAGGVSRDVTFVEADTDAALADELDAEYRRKYKRFADSIVDTVTSGTAREATLRVEPR
jgi:hypothetical protein